MNQKARKFFASVFALLLAVMCVGCGDLTAMKAQYCADLDAYYQEIQAMNLDYSTIFIQYELEKGKEKINAATRSADIEAEVQKTKTQLSRLILSPEKSVVLRETFVAYMNQFVGMSAYAGIDPDNWKLCFYLGEFNGKQVIYEQLAVSATSGCEIQVSAYLFTFRKGYMAFHVIDGNQVYYLNEEYRGGSINDMQVKKIYEYYQLLRANNIY